MSYVPYKVSDDKWYWRGPEVAFRDFDNNGTKDETNAATGTFWTPPVFIGSDNPVMVRKRKKFVQYRSGSRYQKQINFEGYEEILLTFSGPVIHRSWLYYLCDACTTTDNTPTSYYTHAYVNTDSHANPPKSFEMLHKFPNDKSGGGESVLELFTGCTVISYVEKGDEKSNVIMGTWVIKASNIVAGTALTSPGYPSYPNKNFAAFLGEAVLTWQKGGANTNGHLKGYEFGFMTDRNLLKDGTSYYPVNTISPNKVEAYLKVDWMPTETDSYDDSQDDPLSALNKDITLKVARNTTNDYFQIAYVDGFQELDGDPFWVAGNLHEGHKFWINPHESTPSTLTLTEVNDLDDDRYET